MNFNFVLNLNRVYRLYHSLSVNKYLTNNTIEYNMISVLTPNRNRSGLIYAKKVASPKCLSYIHTQKKPSRTAASSQIEILVMILLFSFSIIVLEKNNEKLAHFNKSGYLCVENIVKLFKIYKKQWLNLIMTFPMRLRRW